MKKRALILRMLPALVAGVLVLLALVSYPAKSGYSLGATPSATATIDPSQLQSTFWKLLAQADWGGRNSDMAVAGGKWTFVGTAGGDNAIGPNGNYGFLLMGTIVVTGGPVDGGIRWRVYPNGWNPNVQPWFASSPPITVPAGQTVSIPIVGSYPLTNVTANTGVGFNVDVYPTAPMTIRGGGQGYGGNGGSGTGTPCTVFIGILWPYHEH